MHQSKEKIVDNTVIATSGIKKMIDSPSPDLPPTKRRRTAPKPAAAQQEGEKQDLVVVKPKKISTAIQPLKKAALTLKHSPSSATLTRLVQTSVLNTKGQIQPLVALSVEHGVFLVVSAMPDVEIIRTFARFLETPAPHLISDKKNWLSAERLDGVQLYASYVSTTEPLPTGALTFAAITDSDRRTFFQITCLPWRGENPSRVTELLKRYGRILEPGFAAILPYGHPLRQALSGTLYTGPQEKITSSERSSATGKLQGIKDDMAQGWAFDPKHPGDYLMVDLIEGAEIVAEGLADLFRQDLLAHGVGEGDHHFRLKLSQELFDGQKHMLRAKIQGGDWLPGNVAVILPDRRPREFDVMPRLAMLQLAKDTLIDKKEHDLLIKGLRVASWNYEMGLHANAENIYIALRQKLKSNPAIFCKTAEMMLFRRKYPEAASEYAKAVELAPQQAWPYLGLGNVFQLLGKPVEAFRAYLRAKKIGGCDFYNNARLREVTGIAGVQRAREMLADGARDEALSFLAELIFRLTDDKVVFDEIAHILEDGVDPYRNHSSERIIRVRRSTLLLDFVLDQWAIHKVKHAKLLR